jgi:outer membrane immunogenic protein
MPRIFVPAIFLALLSSTAYSANWTGFYLGAFGGHAWGDYDFDYNPPDVGASTDGWLAGGEIGGNFQSGPAVFGAEADLAWTNIDGSNSCPNAAFDCDTEIDWFGTARGRLGMAAGQFLFFGTGGLAYGDVTGETVLLSGGAVPPSGTPVNGEDNILFGWTAGAGIEALIGTPTNRWTVKGDWLYYDLGDQSFDIDNGLVVDVGHTGNMVRLHVTKLLP